MGRRGPPPKPTILKLVAGNPGGRALNASEPIPPPMPLAFEPGGPAPPPWLEGEAIQVWRHLVPRLSAIGLARSLDEYALGRYCQLLVMWVEVSAFLKKNGPTYPVRADPVNGRPGRVIGVRPWPQQSMVPRLNRELMAIEREFGMTPAARSRITTGAEKTAKGDVGELRKKFLATPAG